MSWHGRARIGLAGPLWGLVASAATYGLFLATDAPSLAASARTSAWINLLNLMPIWQLDGGRAFRALSRPQRWAIAALLGGLFFFTSEGLLLVVAGATAVQAFMSGAPAQGDRPVLLQFAGVAMLLCWLTTLTVPVPA